MLEFVINYLTNIIFKSTFVFMPSTLPVEEYCHMT